MISRCWPNEFGPASGQNVFVGSNSFDHRRLHDEGLELSSGRYRERIQTPEPGFPAQFSPAVVYSMPMETPMHPSLFMGYPEWLELAVFGLLAAIALVLLTQCRLRRTPSPTPASLPLPPQRKWLAIPELQLLMFGLPLELLWEVAQFPLYTVWQEGEWSYILYGLAHCTLGDLLILLVTYWVVALLNRSRYWYRSNILVNGFLFTLLGLAYTIYSEIMNVSIKGKWDYTELMPIIPVFEIGGMPFMQWVLVPPVLLWLMRMFVPYTVISPKQG